MIELITGQPPYADLHPISALFRIVEDMHPPLPENISSNNTDFLLKCFQKVPTDRPTATALLQHDWIKNMTLNRAQSVLTLHWTERRCHSGLMPIRCISSSTTLPSPTISGIDLSSSSTLGYNDPLGGSQRAIMKNSVSRRQHVTSQDDDSSNVHTITGRTKPLKLKRKNITLSPSRCRGRCIIS